MNRFFQAGILLFLLSCNGRHLKKESIDESKRVVNSVVDVSRDSASKRLPDSSTCGHIVNVPFDCVGALHELVNSSSYNPDIKKLNYTVFVDTVNADMAILKITVRNEERGDDMVIGWIKMDFNKSQFLDIVDEDKYVELKCDTILFKKLVKDCR